MAIPNSGVSRPAAPRRAKRWGWWMLLAFLSVEAVSAQNTAAPGERMRGYYHRLYTEARKRCETETNNVKAAWVFARACFDWADLVGPDTQRAEVAQEGIRAARHALVLDPKSAPALHYLALNQGQFARTKLLGALKFLGEMEASWLKSIALDPKFDFASAHRSLGMLYRDAPGWPTSLGDRSKARFHLKKAVELVPGYPDNQLTLIESHLDWGEKKLAAPLVAGLEEILKTARQQLTGDDWVLSWGDWTERWEKIKARMGVTAARSPRLSE